MNMGYGARCAPGRGVIASASGRTAFTLVELLVVIGIIALLVGILLPVVSRARQSAEVVKCLANMQSLARGQALYAAAYGNQLVTAGDGAYHTQGTWIGLLEDMMGQPMVRRCPSDNSPYFSEPIPGSAPAVYRVTSYAINNYVSPTHAPPGVTPIKKITQVRRSSAIVQFAELAERGSYAAADHLHAQHFYDSSLPDITVELIGEQMPIGRHGGSRFDWKSRLNYAFLDGHAETLMLRDAYADPYQNLFDPAVAK